MQVSPSGASDQCASRSASAMICCPNAACPAPPAALFASVAMSMHYLFGIALATLNTRLSSCRGLAKEARLKAREGSADRGDRAHRVVEPHHPLAARRCRHRLDRQLILLHPSRSQPPIALRSAPGRAGRCLAGPWRRLLSHGEVSRRSGPHAGRADLVQVGSLHHLALRLRALGDRLLSRRRALSDRQVGARPHRADGGGGRLRKPAARLAVLRGAVPLAARPA